MQQQQYDVNFAQTLHRSDNYTVVAWHVRHEPILGMFLMPFPLLCSVVAVVACSRSNHVLDVAAAVFLAYAAKPSGLLLATAAEQHVASVLGGLSMGVAACTCVCLACYRMMAEASSADNPEEEAVKK